MKELTKYSRLAGYLEKLYDKLNSDFFNGDFDRPVITIQSTPRAYGHYSLIPYWNVDGTAKRELNIAAGTLNNRPIEHVIATLLHEMCHQYNNEIANTQDCSRGGTYHNKYFKRTAEAEGIAAAKAKGKCFGRPKAQKPDNWNEVIAKWEAGEITAVEAMRQTGIKRSTFYKLNG